MASLDSTACAAPVVPMPECGTVHTADGVALALYRWRPLAPPRAVVALVHGLAEHAQRYSALAARLNAADIELVAVDLRGHGRSPGERTWVQRFDDYLYDAEALLGEAAHSDARVILMGHSMGGAIATLYALEGGRTPQPGVPRLAGLVLSSPALAPGRDVPGWMIAASRLMSRVWPRYPAMRIDPALLSRDAAVVAANRADPLVHHGNIPARTGAELLAAMARIERGRETLTLPVLVYHGTRDKLTEPEGSRAFASHVGSQDVTLTLYEDSYHETMNDLDRDRVIDALIGWITRHA